MFFRKRNAAFGARGTLVDHMQKYGTAAKLLARALIVIDGDHEIIGLVFAPQVLMAGRKR